MKFVLIFVAIILVLSSFILFTSYTATKNELSQKHNSKVLCAGKIKNCNKVPSGIPKGVCAPGRTCT